MTDRWASWLLERRFGGSPDYQRQVMDFLYPIRDRVLEGAAPQSGDTVLDVGCGDGLLGFAVLDRTSPSGRVIFSDVSDELLDQCRQAAEAAGVTDRCEFVHAALPHLDGLGDACVDVVVLRSVLIYVADKQAAFRHLHRVLRPGGRLSLFEPINAFGYPDPAGWLWGLDVSGLEALAERVHAVYREHHGDPCPMLGFDERDLLEWSERAGFQDVRLHYEAQVGSRHPAAATDLSTFLRSAPNPLVPTFGEVLTEALPPGDRQLLTRRLEEQLAIGRGRMRRAVSYLTAISAHGVSDDTNIRSS